MDGAGFLPGQKGMSSAKVNVILLANKGTSTKIRICLYMIGPAPLEFYY